VNRSYNNGYEYEHLEYTPYGETWFEESQEPMLNKIAYKFTGKEIDTETGLYYYGARYYDAKVSRWISADPIIDDYLPVAPVSDEAKKHNQNLPGEGGVFNSINLALYHYAGNNPLKYIDPTGNNIIFRQLLWRASRDEVPTLFLRACNGDQRAKDILIRSGIECAIQMTEQTSNLGNYMVLIGTMHGDPAMIIVGGIIDSASDVTNVALYFVKAKYTGDPDDLIAAIENLGIEAISNLLADCLAEEFITNNVTKKQYKNFLRKYLTHQTRGRFKNITKKAGQKALEQFIEESSGFVLEKAFEVIESEVDKYYENKNNAIDNYNKNKDKK